MCKAVLLDLTLEEFFTHSDILVAVLLLEPCIDLRSRGCGLNDLDPVT